MAGVALIIQTLTQKTFLLDFPATQTPGQRHTVSWETATSHKLLCALSSGSGTMPARKTFEDSHLLGDTRKPHGVYCPRHLTDPPNVLRAKSFTGML